MRVRLRRNLSKLALCAAAGSFFAAPAPAQAQQPTFYLDRLFIGGAPDDATALWRPQMGEKTRVFGQLALGFGYRPFRLENEIPDPNQRQQAVSAINTPVDEQFIMYADAGIEILDRFALQVELPVILFQGTNPTGPAPGATELVSADSTAAGDMRIDARAIVYRNATRSIKVGAEAGLWVPTGSHLSYGGDGSPSGSFLVSAEYDAKTFFVVANTGFQFRPLNQVNGFQVSDEWRYGVGAFVPLRDNQFRVGAQIFGSTGIKSGITSPQNPNASTTFTSQNTPLEWLAEGRMALGQDRQGYVGVAGGTRILSGYSPDFRLLAMVGYWFPIGDTNPRSPNRRWKNNENCSDRDHDGICDDIDLCPDEPEDHKPPNPDDGCPALPDRDGDGIPDVVDKCPDQPEDFDGIQDADGCPEDDADHDGIPDAVDACPKEPGEPDPEPSKNGCPKFIRRRNIEGGGEIQILKQIQFDNGKATIRPGESYKKILDEVVRLLKVNPDITHLDIEGHTDDRGATDMNMTLSNDRAHSVMRYLVEHGIEEKRLGAQGFGPTRPIASNDTADGRQANRRVEFHIRSGGGATPPK